MSWRAKKKNSCNKLRTHQLELPTEVGKDLDVPGSHRMAENWQYILALELQLAQVQRKGTKMIKQWENLFCAARLKKFGLCSPAKQRLRG